MSPLVLTHPLFLSVCILAFPMYLLDFLGLRNRICKKSLPYFLARFTVMYNEQVASKKQELLSNLQEFGGPSGKLSLLELGCGTGPKFKFYPPGCRVTCIDPNPNFEKFLIKSIAENRHLQFEHFLVAAGEDLHQVADDSMDVVVCTLVLCSVKNQERILQEVCRVRRPVNALNFMEHTAAKHSSWNFSGQQFLSLARHFLFETCQERARGVPAAVGRTLLVQ
ncbi:thiol S-methyltransferase TMT1A-like [Phocoena phocoena]|uniref:thiol S-methyltransferase TMT1A-like n=1 Tax=Phocoena phocoena TaxID=9742 RepID=UPI00330704AD